jgi:Tol biopolymer transport system component
VARRKRSPECLGQKAATTIRSFWSYDLYRKSLSGQRAEDVLLATPQVKVPSDWSSDGRVLLYFVLDPKTNADVMGLPLQGGGAPFEVVRTNFNESGAQFSPDAKWIAYRSDKSGRSEVYVQPFPLGQGIERMISSGGGAQPRWRPDGKELFYVALDEQLMAASITPAADGRSVTSGIPVALFRTRVGGAVQGAAEHLYVVSRDGRQFLMATLPEEPAAPPITLILNRK